MMTRFGPGSLRSDKIYPERFPLHRVCELFSGTLKKFTKGARLSTRLTLPPLLVSYRASPTPRLLPGEAARIVLLAGVGRTRAEISQGNHNQPVMSVVSFTSGVPRLSTSRRTRKPCGCSNRADTCMQNPNNFGAQDSRVVRDTGGVSAASPVCPVRGSRVSWPVLTDSPGAAASSSSHPVYGGLVSPLDSDVTKTHPSRSDWIGSRVGIDSWPT